MLSSKKIVQCNASLPAKLRLQSTRTVACSALPPIADISTITCTTSKGVVTCVDDAGASVVGSRLKELQAILRPIAEAPAVDAPPAAKPPAPAQPKTVSDKPDSQSKVPVTAESLVKPSVPEVKTVSATENATQALSTADTKVPAPTPVPTTVLEKTDEKPAAALPAIEVKKEMKQVPQEVIPAVAESEDVAAPAKAVESKTVSTEPSKPATTSSELPKTIANPTESPKPAPKPVIADTASAELPALDNKKAEDVSSKEVVKVAPVSNTTPTSNSTPATPEASVSKPAAKEVQSTPPLVSVTSPIKAAKTVPATSFEEMRTISRGNEDVVTFSTGVTPSGNSNLSLDAPIPLPAPPSKPAAAAQSSVTRLPPGALFPGNIDPRDTLAVEQMQASMNATIAQPKADVAASKPKTINVLNEKGLVPGNLPPELGDILQLVNAINSAPVRNLDLKVYPGNVPPDAAFAPTVLEFTPGNSAGGKDVKAVQLQLLPGNVPPELGDMLDFLGVESGPQAGA